MLLSEAVANFMDYRKGTREKNTVKNYNHFLDRLNAHFKGKALASITPDHILKFLIKDTEGQKQSIHRRPADPFGQPQHDRKDLH